MHFDWSTLVLQTVNVLVLLWLLRRFLFRPVVAIIEQRKAAAEKLLADATAAREEALARSTQAAARDKAVAADRDRVLADARAAAETERAAFLAQARQEAVAVQDAARAGLARERGEMLRSLETEARDLAVAIASRLLRQLPAEALNAALLRSADAWIASLPQEDMLALTGSGEPLLVLTAAPLDDAGKALLGHRFGVTPLRFETDPSLIAGIELHGSHARLRNNWRADLDRIAEELKQDDHPLAMA